MEILYLLASIISNTFISLTLSILIPFQYLYSFISSKQIPTTKINNGTKKPMFLYQGSVSHERKLPVYHSFRYSARYALFDLDIAPQTLPRSFFKDHLSAQQAREITKTNGPVFLLTIPPSVGYEQNPLSVYYCYELDGSDMCLNMCIAEVTNTPWGERVSFVFRPNSDIVAKPLHVSPFMDMLGNWSMRTDTPGDNLFLAISVQHPELGDYFTATLKAKRVSSWTFGPVLFFWMMPQKVALWIYWEALKLWWKNVCFIQHPRYHSPSHREESLMRNEKLQCCLTIGNDEKKSGHRWCVWRDAQWPWT